MYGVNYPRGDRDIVGFAKPRDANHIPNILSSKYHATSNRALPRYGHIIIFCSPEILF